MNFPNLYPRLLGLVWLTAVAGVIPVIGVAGSDMEANKQGSQQREAPAAHAARVASLLETLDGTESAVYSDTTVGGPTWQRPVSRGTGASGSCDLSGLGTNVPYHTLEFRVSQSGDYDIVSVQDYDGFVLIYEGAFNPADQCLNLIALNDDGPLPGFSSEIYGLSLNASNTYTLVTTGFANTSAGSFTNTISGPGAVTLASSAEYSASTVGGPRWHRPMSPGTGASGSCNLSGLGTNVPYHTLEFRVSQSGDYDIVSIQDYDGYILVYDGGFDPDDPCLDLIALNDDGPLPGFTSEIYGLSLDASTTYTLVTTGFANSSIGNFTNTITGFGEITLVFSLEYSASTTNGPLWRRPLSPGTGASGSCSLSSAATAVAYHTIEFEVAGSGGYDIVSVQNYDGYIFVYENGFNPDDPCLNLVAINDDGPLPGFTSEIYGLSLNASSTYTLVTSGFSNASVGNFTNTISGPAPIVRILPDMIFSDRFEE